MPEHHFMKPPAPGDICQRGALRARSGAQVPARTRVTCLATALAAAVVGSLIPVGSPTVSASPLETAVVPVAAQQTNGALADSFRNPPPEARPQIRFWTPNAAVTEEGLRRDIQQLARQGFGGFEVVAMNAPAGAAVPNVVPDEYRWGTPRWNALMVVAVDEAAKHGMTVDFNNGPSWPIAMPGVESADDPASLYELTYGSMTLQPGQAYTGPVPERKKKRDEGTPKLGAVLAYRMIDDTTLDEASVVDLTGRVEGEGTTSTVSFTAPAGLDRWMLLSFWEQPAAQKVNDLYVIDHLSPAGTDAVREYWASVLPSLGGRLENVGSLFSDSMEYAVTMDWTRGLLTAFKAQHGYDLSPYLPFIGHAKTYPANEIPGFTSLHPEVGRRVNADYLQTLTKLYLENHVRPMQQIAEGHGLTGRYQVGYNKPFEVPTAALGIAEPETEAFGRSALDGMRYMAGAVHLGDKPRYSIESAAEFLNDYGQSLEDILWWTKRAWATGVNVQRLHGASYSGDYDGPGNIAGQLPGNIWPGYNAFHGTVSNQWNRQTSDAALKRTIDYMARTNFVLQKTAKVDVAIYWDGLDVVLDPESGHGDGNAVYPDQGVLNAHGYSYDLLTSALLSLPQAEMQGGRLDPEGPGYKALIVHNEESLALSTVTRIRDLAAAGLKVILVGKTPDRGSSFADQRAGETDTQVQAAVARLLTMPTVRHVADYAQVPDALRSVGVRADAELQAPVDVLTQHRTDPTGDFYYVYNYNKVSDADATSLSPRGGTTYPNLDEATQLDPETAQLSLAGAGDPYLMDAWSGEIQPVPVWSREGGRVNLTLPLDGDEAVLVALLTDDQATAAGLRPARLHAIDPPTPTASYSYHDEKLVLSATADGTYQSQLSNGHDPKTSIQGVQRPRTIKDWRLSVESVERPTSLSSSFFDSTQRDVGTFAVGEQLRPWRTTSPLLASVSGVGTYTGTFPLERGADQGHGAYLDLGEVEDGFTLTVNGHPVPGVDQLDTRVDIGPYVVAGTNTVTVTVSTTIYNAVFGPHRDYGLLGSDGTVEVQPYRTAVIGGPDLTVANLAASQAEPKQTELSVTVTNRGDADTAGVTVEFRDGPHVLGRTAPIAVLSGGSVPVSLIWDTRGVKGDRVVTAVVDPANAIAESSETNNSLTRTITIRGNKVTNGSFESSTDGKAPDGWSSSGSTYYDTSGVHSSDGTDAVAISKTGTPTGTASWTSAPIAVTAGQTYDLAMTVSTLNASSPPAMSVSYLGPTGAVLTKVTAIGTDLTGNTAARQVTGRITVPAGVSELRLTLTGFPPTDLTSTGTVRFDDVWMW